jgi:hypothetical protein
MMLLRLAGARKGLKQRSPLLQRPNNGRILHFCWHQILMPVRSLKVVLTMSIFAFTIYYARST